MLILRGVILTPILATIYLVYIKSTYATSTLAIFLLIMSISVGFELDKRCY